MLTHGLSTLSCLFVIVGIVLGSDGRRDSPDYTPVIDQLQRDVPRLLKENGVPGTAIALVDEAWPKLGIYQGNVVTVTTGWR